MCRVFRGQFVAFWRARLSSADQPAIVIGGEKKLIVPILNLIQIESFLVSDGIRMAAAGMACQGETEKGKTVDLGLLRIEDWRLHIIEDVRV
jgi:hypothetical protein